MTPSAPRPFTRARTSLTLFALLTLIACGDREGSDTARADSTAPPRDLLGADADTARPTPAPSFQDPTTVAAGEVIAYGRSLQFDSIGPASDSARLPDETPGASGTPGWSYVDPERGSLTISRGDLAHGRIIGRIRSAGRFTRLGLAPGVNYVWVDSVAAGWRTLVFPENPGRDKPYGIRAVAVRPDSMALRAEARWVRGRRSATTPVAGISLVRLQDEVGGVWVTCARGCCCIDNAAGCTPDHLAIGAGS